MNKTIIVFLFLFIVGTMYAGENGGKPVRASEDNDGSLFLTNPPADVPVEVMDTIITDLPDIIYLRQGEKVRGTILTNESDSTVKIKRMNGSIEEYKRSDILMMRRQVETPRRMTNKTNELQSGNGSVHFELAIGGAIPVGNFASKSGGWALPGFLFGASMAVDIVSVEGSEFALQWLTNAVVSFNQMGDDIPEGITKDIGFWITGWPTTGIRLKVPVNNSSTFFVSGTGGALFGSSPPASLSGGSATFNQTSGSAFAPAYRLGAGLLLGDGFVFEASYVYSKPKYNITRTGSSPSGSATGTMDIEQPTSIFFATIGLVL